MIGYNSPMWSKLPRNLRRPPRLIMYPARRKAFLLMENFLLAPSVVHIAGDEQNEPLNAPTLPVTPVSKEFVGSSANVLGLEGGVAFALANFDTSPAPSVAN